MAKKKEAAEDAAPKRAAKKVPEGPTPEERAAALMADVNKKMRGRAVLMKASDYRLPYLTKRLPTGILTLDAELRGGWPAGGVSQVIGRRNAGKTLLVWLTIRQLQLLLGNKARVLLAMTEIPADRSQARNAGVKISLGDEDIEELIKAREAAGWPPFTREQLDDLRTEVGTIHELHAMAAEDFYDVILRAVEENIYHLIVIDSIGNALAAAEQENDSVHDKTYGGTSGPNTTFLKKLTNLLTMPMENGEVRDTCIIGVNQVRDNIKDPNKPYKAPGGNALEHAKLVDVYVESGSMIGSEEKIYTVTPEGPKTMQRFIATGKQVNWKIEKGKAGIHEGGRGSYIYDFSRNNVDFFTDALIAGVQHGIIEQAGAWLSITNKATGEYILRAQGKDAFVQALIDDIAQAAAANREPVMAYIQDEVYRKLGISIDYDNWT